MKIFEKIQTLLERLLAAFKDHMPPIKPIVRSRTIHKHIMHTFLFLMLLMVNKLVVTQKHVKNIGLNFWSHTFSWLFICMFWAIGQGVYSIFTIITIFRNRMDFNSSIILLFNNISFIVWRVWIYILKYALQMKQQNQIWHIWKVSHAKKTFPNSRPIYKSHDRKWKSYLRRKKFSIFIML